MSFDQITSRFGTTWYEPRLFYQDRRSIRFELGTGDDKFTYFCQAFMRASRIVQRGLSDADDAHAVISIFAYDPADRVRGARDVARQLRKIGLPRPSRARLHVVGDRSFAVLPMAQEHQRHALLWGSLAAEFAFEPAIGARVYFVSVGKGILLYPYDSRGMDVTGPNTALVASIADEFDEMLLDYDREEIRRRYPKQC